MKRDLCRIFPTPPSPSSCIRLTWPYTSSQQFCVCWPALVFSFPGLWLASVVSSMPFALQPLVQAFERMGNRPMEVAATLRATPLDAFFTIVLPQAKPGLLTAAVLTFAHTVGEFGVVMMIGGNVPGQTRVVSTEIYGLVEAMDYGPAHTLAALMVAFSFGVLLLLTRLSRPTQRSPA